MKYIGNLGFGMFGWGDSDIGIFGGVRSGGYQKAGQFRCKFSIYDTEFRCRTGEDKEVGTLELIVSVPEDEDAPHEIMEIVSLEIDRRLRGQGYGRRAVEAVMRAAVDDIKVSDIKKTKVAFWQNMGLEELSTRGGTLSGSLRKEPLQHGLAMAR